LPGERLSRGLPECASALSKISFRWHNQSNVNAKAKGTRANTPAKFWRQAEAPSLFECWLWKGTVGTHGYGQISFEGKIWRAHRLAFFLHNGTLDETAVICHSCDNPLCVNPAHLFAGTHADNVAGMVRKGRQARGDRIKGPTMEQRLRGAAHYASKVDEEDLREIRRLRAMGYTLLQLAQRFPLHPMTIGEIARREIWRDVA
jgi:hypothetical protein